MERTPKKNLDSYKFSLDVSGSNKVLLDILAEELGMKYGPVVNMIISTFCDMPEDIKHEFMAFCKSKREELEIIYRVAGDCEKDKIKKERHYYLSIIKLINKGIIENIEPETIIKERKKVELKTGYVIIPDDWILLNPEDAKNCMEVDVVECRHSEEYGIPHFVYFTNDYKNEDETLIEEMCVKAHPKFREIIDMQVKPLRNSDGKGKILNAEEYMAAPTIGHFPLPEKGENSNPPFGAMIVRD